MAYLWHLWPGRGWPYTPSEETELVERWRRDDGDGTVRRDAMIVVMGVLRSGSDPDDIARLVPGIPPADLAASHRHLDTLRDAAVAAHRRMCAPETLDRFFADAVAAERLNPAPAGMLRLAAHNGGLAGVRLAGLHVAARAGQVRAEADEVVAALASADDPVTLGRLLFDPYTPGLWGDPYFVAERVGELTPVRVRTLLGEHPDSDLIFTDT